MEPIIVQSPQMRADALTSLFLRGAPPTSPSVLLDLAVASSCSIAALMIGLVLFRKYGKA